MSHEPGGAKRRKLAHYEEAAVHLEVSLDPVNMIMVVDVENTVGMN